MRTGVRKVLTSIILMQYDAMYMNNQEPTNSYKGVLRLAQENPNWVPIVEAALETAKSTHGDFAGAWVLNRAKEKGVSWFPNLRMLVTYGILKKEGTARAGRRAYYSMPDPASIEAALNELKQDFKKHDYK